MSVKFLSSNDQNEFKELLEGSNELREIFPMFMTQLELNTDYDTVMVSFNNSSLRARIEDSPFLVEFNEDEQSISLEKLTEYDEFEVIEEWDFDEDAAEEAVDFIGDQITNEDIRGEIDHYGL